MKTIKGSSNLLLIDEVLDVERIYPLLPTTHSAGLFCVQILLDGSILVSAAGVLSPLDCHALSIIDSAIAMAVADPDNVI